MCFSAFPKCFKMFQHTSSHFFQRHVHHNVIHSWCLFFSNESHIQFHFAAQFQCAIPAFQGRKFWYITFISWWWSWRFLWILLYQGSTDVESNALRCTNSFPTKMYILAKHVKARIHQAKSGYLSPLSTQVPIRYTDFWVSRSPGNLPAMLVTHGDSPPPRSLPLVKGRSLKAKAIAIQGSAKPLLSVNTRLALWKIIHQLGFFRHGLERVWAYGFFPHLPQCWYNCRKFERSLSPLLWVLSVHRTCSCIPKHQALFGLAGSLQFGSHPKYWWNDERIVWNCGGHTWRNNEQIGYGYLKDLKYTLIYQT